MQSSLQLDPLNPNDKFDHSKQSLSATAFDTLATSSHEEQKIEEVLSTEVSEEDLAEAYTDEYGVRFSPDQKRLLLLPKI